MEFNLVAKQPLQVGIVGTGYAAKQRVKAFQADPRAQVVAVAGNTLNSTLAFTTAYGIRAYSTWTELLKQGAIDLVVVCHANHGHGAVVRAALTAGIAVVVEYPLALSVEEAIALITLAQQQRLLLHVEHIELLGSLHQTMRTYLPHIGAPAYVRYCTAKPQHPAPQKWTYDASLFGFPLAGALSRIHRLTNLFGAVRQVSCHLQYDGALSKPPNGYFHNCRCIAQLQFDSGVIAEVMYAKGEHTWHPQRWMAVEGDRGALIFDGDRGTVISPEGTRNIDMAKRQGLFAQDTAQVLDALYDGRPLYVTPQESLYALNVAMAAEQSAKTGNVVAIEPTFSAS